MPTQTLCRALARLAAASVITAAPTTACNGDIIEIDEPAEAGVGGQSAGGAGGTGGEVASGGTPANGPKLDTPARIAAWLDEKILTMTPDTMPSHPNGYDEDVNYGQATQCYQRVVIEPREGRWLTKSQLGTLVDAPSVGDRGTCDHETAGALLDFASTAVLIENVQGDAECFDITMTYPGFSQEGRGSVVGGVGADAEVHLEIFFKDQAAGHRCADGTPGDDTVTLNCSAFTGDAT